MSLTVPLRGLKIETNEGKMSDLVEETGVRICGDSPVYIP